MFSVHHVGLLTGLWGSKHGFRTGPLTLVVVAEEDEQHPHGPTVEHLQHIKGSNTGHAFSRSSSSLLTRATHRKPVSSVRVAQPLKKKEKKEMYCKGSVYVNYVYDFVKRHSLCKTFPSAQSRRRRRRPAETLFVQEQSAAVPLFFFYASVVCLYNCLFLCSFFFFSKPVLNILNRTIIIIIIVDIENKNTELCFSSVFLGFLRWKIKSTRYLRHEPKKIVSYYYMSHWWTHFGVNHLLDIL